MFHRVISHTVYWPVDPWAVQRPLSALPLTLGVAPRPLAFASSRLQPWLPADDGQAMWPCFLIAAQAPSL